MHRLHGESGDAAVEGSGELVADIRAKIKEYGLANAYNMDETAWFYNMPPDTTISQNAIEGSKKDKTRITIAFTCNSDGTDRFVPLFIGHAKAPRCFNRKTAQQHGLYYMYNKKAWMTGVFFQDYLHYFDAYVSRTDPTTLFFPILPRNILSCILIQQLSHQSVSTPTLCFK